MLQKIKSFISKRAKKVLFGIVAAAFTCITLSISAYASEDASSSSSVMGEAISSAATVIQAEFAALVNTLVPVLVTIAISGLGMYAVIMLFKFAKKLFAKAAG